MVQMSYTPPGTYVPARQLVGAGIDYTSTTDSTAAIQTILNAASAAATAVGSFTKVQVYALEGSLKITGLTLPTNVELIGSGTRLNAGGSGPMITTAGSRWRLSNFYLSGAGAGAGASGIVNPAGNGYFGVLEYLQFDNFSGRAILLQGLAVSVHDVFAQNCLLTTAGLATKTGVLEITGTDHHIYGNVEVTASRSSLSSVNAYAGAVVVTGSSNFLSDVLAETSDFGFYISANDLIMVGCRADLCRGNGFEIGAGTGTITACFAISNGQDATNTYDAFFASGGAFRIVGCSGYSQTANLVKYGFHDTQNSNSSKNSYIGCNYAAPGTATFNTANYSGASVQVANDYWSALATGATPSVDNRSTGQLANTGPTTITNFTNGVAGQELLIIGEGFSTIQSNATIITRSGQPLFMRSGTIVQFKNIQGIWTEVGVDYKVAGTAVLVAGTKAITDTNITALSRIRLTNLGAGGTLGILSVALNAGTGFTINSTSGTDTSSIYYEIVQY